MPAFAVARAITRSWHASDVRTLDASHFAISPDLLATTLLWALGVAFASVALAWLPAHALARTGALSRSGAGPLAALVVVPMLLPSYLIYHALGQSRAPQTLLGDWLEHLSHTAMPAAPVLAGRIIAFAGISLWMWPLAALIMGWSLSHVPAGVSDALRIDGAPRWRRHLVFFSLIRSSVLWAFSLIALLMLGSSVTLHLAQVPTIAIQAWISINIDPTHVKVWLLTWPILLLACAASVLFARSLSRSDELSLPDAPPPLRINPDWTRVALGCLTCAATLLPLTLYSLTLRSWHSLATFLRISGDALLRSAALALIVASALTLLALATWYLLAQGRRRSVAIIAFLAMLGLLLPGSLVGQAWALAINLPFMPAAIIDSPVPTLAAHVTRFAGLAVLAGVFFARTESPLIAAQRALDAGSSLRGWCLTALAGKVPALLGLLLAFACLSLHEIDSSIVLQQPGTQSLAQTLLAQLHFARQEEMAAGAIIVAGGGLLIAVLAALLVTRTTSRD